MFIFFLFSRSYIFSQLLFPNRYIPVNMEFFLPSSQGLSVYSGNLESNRALGLLERTDLTLNVFADTVVCWGQLSIILTELHHLKFLIYVWCVYFSSVPGPREKVQDCWHPICADSLCHLLFSDRFAGLGLPVLRDPSLPAFSGLTGLSGSLHV